MAHRASGLARLQARLGPGDANGSPSARTRFPAGRCRDVPAERDSPRGGDRRRGANAARDPYGAIRSGGLAYLHRLAGEIRTRPRQLKIAYRLALSPDHAVAREASGKRGGSESPRTPQKATSMGPLPG